MPNITQLLLQVSAEPQVASQCEVYWGKLGEEYVKTPYFHFDLVSFPFLCCIWKLWGWYMLIFTMLWALRWSFCLIIAFWKFSGGRITGNIAVAVKGNKSPIISICPSLCPLAYILCFPKRRQGLFRKNSIFAHANLRRPTYLLTCASQLAQVQFALANCHKWI